MNISFNNAKKNKNDEFYTQENDIGKELSNYDLHGYSVYSNCDSFDSAFVKYFISNFNSLGIKNFYATSYSQEGRGDFISYNGKNIKRVKLRGNGDFRSEECLKLLKFCDVVITNPPFSLFRDFISLMNEYGKKYLIVGPQSACSYKDYFPYIMNNNAMTGNNLARSFNIKDGGKQRFGNICWWTNIKNNGNRREMKQQNNTYQNKYPRLDNYDAILVNELNNIPSDYEGVMAVPITYMNYHDPNMYKIVGLTSSSQNNAGKYHKNGTTTTAMLNGKKIFVRLLIKKIKNV